MGQLIEYYGVPTPLNQMAQISVPEARVLLITPYDKSSLKDIEHALLASDLGMFRRALAPLLSAK